MPLFETIILPLDGSEPSESAIPYAAALAELTSAPIVVIHVLEEMHPVFDARRGEVVGLGDTGPPAVPVRAGSQGGHDRLAEGRHVDAAEHHVVVDLQTKGDGVERDSMGVGARPVDGVDDPTSLARGRRFGAFLPQDGVVGKPFRDEGAEHFLDGMVHRGDLAAVGFRGRLRATEVILGVASGAFGGVDGEFHQRVAIERHGIGVVEGSDAGAWGALSRAGARGSTRVKMLPRPTSLSTSIRPPSSSA